MGRDRRTPSRSVRAVWAVALLRLLGGSSTDNVVVGNFLGTNASATFVNNSGDSSNGVHIQQGAKRNIIGTSSLADRNLISGNAGKGIAIYDVSTDNVIRNNVIGLAPNGTSRLANRSHGVDLNVGASRNIIGGAGVREGNVISGNGFYGNPGIVGGEGSGIEISHDQNSSVKTTGNQFIGNLIGTTADGSAGTSATRNAELYGTKAAPGPLAKTVQYAIDIWSGFGKVQVKLTPDDLLDRSFLQH